MLFPIVYPGTAGEREMPESQQNLSITLSLERGHCAAKAIVKVILPTVSLLHCDNNSLPALPPFRREGGIGEGGFYVVVQVFTFFKQHS